jgi:hypothetical protein
VKITQNFSLQNDEDEVIEMPTFAQAQDKHQILLN